MELGEAGEGEVSSWDLELLDSENTGLRRSGAGNEDRLGDCDDVDEAGPIAAVAVAVDSAIEVVAVES